MSAPPLQPRTSYSMNSGWSSARTPSPPESPVRSPARTPGVPWVASLRSQSARGTDRHGQRKLPGVGGVKSARVVQAVRSAVVPLKEEELEVEKLPRWLFGKPRTPRGRPRSERARRPSPVHASNSGVSAEGSSDSLQGLSKRDLSVSIQPKDKGFTLKWTTVTHKKAGKAKRKAYSIDFRPSARPTIFASAMRRNKFGGSVPLDPLKGEPYVWGRLHGSTLTVHALMITDDGGYEIQVYERTLTETGLDLTFSRIRDGEQLKLIKGTLKKVK